MDQIHESRRWIGRTVLHMDRRWCQQLFHALFAQQLPELD